MNPTDLAYLALAGVTAPWWLRKRRRGWSERLGRVGSPPASRPRVMLHGVSVGEVNALRGLVPRLATSGHGLVVSAGTDTGLARARELFTSTAHVVRYPLDFSSSVDRFLDAVEPDCVALVELEVWPNLVRACRARSVPVLVINGRLSERSFRGYRRIRPLIRSAFASLTSVMAQDEIYADRFVSLGVCPSRCSVTGSMKWDSIRIEDDVAGSADLARSLGIDRSRPLIVAGSTGPGEEALLHASCPPGVQLLCAPRRPERFEEAAAALPGCRRRSKPDQPASGERFLLDSIGELRAAYALADVVIVGRSFGDLFGSDPVEPIALGKATLMGPAAGDFQSTVGPLEAGGGLARTTRERLAGDLARVLADAALRRGMGARGRDVIRANQGATERHALAIEAAIRASVASVSGREGAAEGPGGGATSLGARTNRDPHAR